MAISTEADSGPLGVAVALETFERGIVVPRPFAEVVDIARVNIGIRAPNAVVVGMAARLRASGTLLGMTGRARFDILPGGVGMGLRIYSR